MNTDYYHTLIVEREEDDGWYKVTYKVSDGFKTSIIMDQSALVSLYNLIGKALRADPTKESIWSATTVQGS